MGQAASFGHPLTPFVDKLVVPARRVSPSRPGWLCGSRRRCTGSIAIFLRRGFNEVVDILVRFEVFCGRYMYHCHVLEHEDHDMMRPFVVMPAELMPFMDMHAGHAGNRHRATSG